MEKGFTDILLAIQPDALGGTALFLEFKLNTEWTGSIMLFWSRL